MKDDPFWRAYVATRTLLGGAPAAGELPSVAATALAAELGKGSRTDRAGVLARELAPIARALEERRLR